MELVRQGGSRALDLLAQCFALFRHRIVEAVSNEADGHRTAEKHQSAEALAAVAEKIRRGEFDHD
ncbi:MAG: hypothetical protein QM775_21965 [Pirellulales bacterium]